MKNMEGQRVPDVTFRTREGAEWKDITSKELFAGKKVVVFALPGAFTPTCSSAHVPRYNELAPALGGPASTRSCASPSGTRNPTVIRQRRLPGAEVDVTPEVRIAAGAESSTRLSVDERWYARCFSPSRGDRMRIKSLAVAVALLASTTGCVAGADEDIQSLSCTSEALGWSGAPASLHYDEDAPMPLDHPEPLPPIDFRMPSAHPFDIFREPGGGDAIR